MMFILMDLDLFLVIPLALLWDIFAKREDNQQRSLKMQLVRGLMLSVFASLFIVTYFIFNNYVDIDTIKSSIPISQLKPDE